MNAKEKMQMARSRLVMRHPFFGVLALRLRLEEAGSIDTAATDGEHLFYNPKFIDTLTVPQCSGLVAHEVLHCANGHVWRRALREMKKWNYACDLAINPIIRDAGLELPEGGLEDGRYSGMSAETIYARLPDFRNRGSGGQESGESGGQSGEGSSGQGNKEGSNQGGGESGNQGDSAWNFGGILDGAPEEAAKRVGEWQQAAITAAHIAKQQGKLPLGLERLVKELSRPRLSWRDLLWQFVQRTSRLDYSWQRPNSRYAVLGAFLPELRSEQMPPMVVVVDTSGSVGGNELSAFEAEIRSIAEQMRPEHLYVVYCDAMVARVEMFGPEDPIALKPMGGGGTDFRPPFDWARNNDVNPCCLVYFTDMYGIFPKEPPEYPVMWITTTDREGPWGETVRLVL